MNREDEVKAKMIIQDTLGPYVTFEFGGKIYAHKLHADHIKDCMRQYSDYKLQSLQQRVKELELQLSGKTFFDEKEVLVNRVKELEGALKQIEQMSDTGSYSESVVRMKEIATKSLLNPTP